MPTPSTPIATRKEPSSSSGSIVSSSSSVATKHDQQPGPDQRSRREALRQRRAGERGDEEADRGGQHPHAGFERVEALDDLQVERDREEDPHQDQVLGEQHRDVPPRREGMRSRRKWTSGGSPTSSRWRSQPRKPPRSERPGGDHERGQREPEGLDRRVARPQPAPVARLEDAEDDQRQPRGGEHAADPVEPLGRRPPARAPDQAGADQDADRDDDLADEDEPPGELGRRPAAEDRADRDPGPGDAAEHAVGDRAIATLGSCRRRARPAPAGPARRRSPPGSTSRASARERSRRRRSGAEPTA